MGLSANSVLVKAAVIVAIALLLLIPISLLHGLVSERTSLRAQALAQIADGWGGQQAVGGPVLVVPTSAPGVTPGLTRALYVLPESLDVDVRLTVEKESRRIGMYAVPVFVAEVKVSGEFDLPAAVAAARTRYDALSVQSERARVVIPVRDLRGLRRAVETEPRLLARSLEPASVLSVSALDAPLRADADLGAGKQRFAFELTLAGTEAFEFLPLAGSSRVSIAGNWPHPGLSRGLLPLERQISDTGFKARWQTLAVNRGLPRHWFEADLTTPSLTGSDFGVDIVQPVDLYARVERAVKYAGLFIAMSLLSLFLWEHLARRRIHPVQYGLLGLALSIFYLLLLALAEHIGFNQAYALAAFALCALLGIYLAGAFGSAAAGGATSAAFGVLYGLLFLIVTAEDYALLAGALSLFALLAAVMLLTRRLDWYRVGRASDDADD